MTGATERAPGLVDLGLRPGDTVRFRPRAGKRWQEATVVQRERDGSVGLRDGRGAARALPVDRLEVRTTGRRGGRTWEPVTARAARVEQLDLFADAPPAPPPGPRRRRG